MHPDSTKALIAILEQQVRDTKRAYNTGTPGVTYDDMAASARRLLEMKACIERATGRPVRTKVTSLAIASVLRAA